MESQTKVCATYMITTILFDIGGVLLTDGWGHESRRAAAAQFGLDWDDFTDRNHGPHAGALSRSSSLLQAAPVQPRRLPRICLCAVAAQARIARDCAAT